MNYNTLLDMAITLGYELAMSGAETFRVEESISRVLAAYGVDAEVFAIPNYLVVTILDEGGKPITRMRRIGTHGNDLDAVEKFSALSRAYCNRKPDPLDGVRWMEEVKKRIRTYSLPLELLGDFIGAGGFALLFAGNWVDAIWGGICGIIVGLTSKLLENLRSNPFFRTIAASFCMAFVAYTLAAFGLTPNPDAVTIGALMILVPGLLFTNAMRDIIYGDTNSGLNRIVQVMLTAIAIALGTAVAWSVTNSFLDIPPSAQAINYTILSHALFSFVGCMGFAILFNIHGPGVLLCGLGGALSWAIYLMVIRSGHSDILGYFWSSLFASVYSETMARIRKYPAISYLVISIFPLIPGAGAYYTMNYAVRGQMDLFASQGMHTAAIAGILAVGILLGSTSFRMYSDWKMKKISK